MLTGQGELTNRGLQPLGHLSVKLLKHCSLYRVISANFSFNCCIMVHTVTKLFEFRNCGVLRVEICVRILVTRMPPV